MTPSDAHNERADRPCPACPDISVVIVNWNVAEMLADCLDSLARGADGLHLEVWVVDNASSDFSVAMLRERYPWVKLIANEDNRGFARANNQAIRCAAGRFVLLLNPDTVVTEGALRNLHDFLAEHPEVGAAGPNLRRPDGGPDRMAARRFYTLGSALWLDALRLHALPLVGPPLHRRLSSVYDFDRTQPVEAISGAAMLVRRDLLQQLGGFGEDYLHCGEDLDLCFRIHAAGPSLWYVAESVIIHYGAASSKQASVRSAVNTAISAQRFFRHCYGPWHALGYRMIVQCVEAPTLLLVGCLKALVGLESRAELKQRLQTARGLLAWREMK